MYSCKLGSLALLLALSASHHFILLHCQEPGIALEYGEPPPPEYGEPPPPEYGEPPPPEYGEPPPPEYGEPPPPDGEPPPPEYGEPPPPEYGEPPPPPPPHLKYRKPPPPPPPEYGEPPPLSPPQLTPDQAPIGLITGAVIGSVVLIVGLSASFFIWRKIRTTQPAQPLPQPPKAVEEVASSSPPIGLSLGATTFEGVAPSSLRKGSSLGPTTSGPTKFTYEDLVSATNGQELVGDQVAQALEGAIRLNINDMTGKTRLGVKRNDSVEEMNKMRKKMALAS